MPRSTKPLTDTQIKNAKPKEKIYNLNDGRNLSLRITPMGSKKWLFAYYRPYDNKRTSITLGSYPETTLQQARQKSAEARELLEQKIDPKTHREDQIRQENEKRSNTLHAVATQWFEIYKAEVTPDTAKDSWRSLELHIFPKLKDEPISQVSPQQVISALKPLKEKGNFETIKRVTQRVRAILDFALNTGLVDRNPLVSVHKAFAKPKVKHMPTIEVEYLPQLLSDLKEASIDKTTYFAILLQLHTMLRPNEVTNARWSEINFSEKKWVIPSDRMKKRQEHEVPLSTQAISILEKMHKITGGKEYIFASTESASGHMNSQTPNAVLKRIGYKNKLVAHGLRALASTTLNNEELETIDNWSIRRFDKDVIETALSHKEKDSSRAPYSRTTYLNQRKTMMQWWSDLITQAEIDAIKNQN